MSEDAVATDPRTPWHLWLIGILGLLWDSMGGTLHSKVQQALKA